MTPRLRITSVAFSLRADQADGVADNAITSAKILNGTVTTVDIADGTVATADLADNSVTSAKIVDGTIAAADLASNSVTTVKIADNAVTSAKILDGTIIGTDINSNAALTVQSITYSAAKTGYISGTSWALGRSLFSTGSFTYSSGLYNNGTGTAFYEVPVQLPDGVTLTEVIVYGYDADATLQLSFNASRQTLASSSGSVLGSASSGIAFASGNCQLVATLSATIDNSLYSYYLELFMPNTINVRYFSFRAKFTYTTPGYSSKDGQPEFETRVNQTKPTEDPQKLQGSVIVE
jgi:molybdopterin-binding protein